ncbi:Na+/H+ antiporter NhaA [Desulforegula conservatrix]|uniref:Na+/H+ antiporter NhaA n=1 Tax=Desulforegula conservatrix TaxID=153026 RepID=UPI00040A87A8|nr:Na+/H+ antiporter NhaA [Desulforegula conservatrix]
MRRTINLLREFSIPLISGVIIGLIWANLSPDTYHHLNEAKWFKNIDFHFFVNDVFMVFFFAIAAVEITKSFHPGGNLNPIKKAINPIIATLGGVTGPIVVYITMNHFIGSPEFANGWGIPTATDIALAWLLARFVFGSDHPAVSFLLLLAIADDAIGLVIIAIFYPDLNNPVNPAWFLLVFAAMIAAYLLRKYNTKNYWPYLILGGIPSWTGLFLAHMHPALALIFIVPFMPCTEVSKGELYEDDPSDQTPLAKFEHEWKVIVDFGLLMFGISNAGVEFSEISTATWLVFCSLLFGKTIGVFVFGRIGMAMGFPLPDRMDSKTLFVAGNVAGLGLTVALFVAGQAFTGEVQGAAKMGALFSAVISLSAVVLSKLLKIKKID